VKRGARACDDKHRYQNPCGNGTTVALAARPTGGRAGAGGVVGRRWKRDGRCGGSRGWGGRGVGWGGRGVGRWRRCWKHGCARGLVANGAGEDLLVDTLWIVKRQAWEINVRHKLVFVDTVNVWI
jgi:hypothetical protein